MRTYSNTTPAAPTPKSTHRRPEPGPAPAARFNNSGTPAGDPRPPRTKLAQQCCVPMEPFLPPAPTLADPAIHPSTTPTPENGQPARTFPQRTDPPTDRP